MDPHTPTVKHIAGQAVYQLAVLYGLIFYAPALLGIPGEWNSSSGSCPVQLMEWSSFFGGGSPRFDRVPPGASNPNGYKCQSRHLL